MLYIAIVEDEEKWQRVAKNEIERHYGTNAYIDFFQTGEKFLEKCQDYDMIFMDIELPGKDGFEIAEEYVREHRDTLLIIMTTHTEMSRKGYQVNAFRYIDKFHPEEIAEALQSAEKRKRRLKRIAFQFPNAGEVKLCCKDIIYLESDNHNIKVQTLEETLVCREKMEYVKEMLEEFGFFLIHRSYLINLDHVKDFNKKDVIMSNEEFIPISRDRYVLFKKNYFQWKFENANA